MHIYSSNESLSCVNHIQQVSLQRVTGFGEEGEEGGEEKKRNGNFAVSANIYWFSALAKV